MAGQLHCTITEEEKARIPNANEKAFLESGADLGSVDIDHVPTHNEKAWLTANVDNNALTDAEYDRLPTISEKEFLEALVTEDSEAYCNLGAPVVADVDRVVVSVQWADNTLSIAAQPDVPRNLTATLTDANNSVTGTLTITGVDRNGNTITETMTPAGDGNGKTLTGTKIFASVTSCIISATGGSNSGDMLVIGIGNVIGLPMDITNTNQVSQVLFNGAVIAAPTLASGVSTSGVNVASSTYNGAKVLEAYVTGSAQGTIGSNIPSPAEKAWLKTQVATSLAGLTSDQISHLPSHNEKGWITAEQSANHVGVLAAERAWVTSELGSSHVAVTVAERGLLTALLAGAAAFPISLGAPILADVDRIVAEVDWDDGTLVIAAQPDVPRNITATLTDADSSTSGTVTITGTDINGRAVVETMSPNGAGNGKTLTGTKIFKTVTSVVITLTAGSGDDDHLVVGVGNLIGVPVDLANAAELVLARLDGAIDADVTVATGVSTSGVNSSAHTYNGSKILDVIIQMGLT